MSLGRWAYQFKEAYGDRLKDATPASRQKGAFVGLGQGAGLLEGESGC